MIVVYIILGAVLLMLMIALFTKKEYVVKRSIIINQTDHIVYDYLRFFKNHRTFNAWFLKDPDMKEASKNFDGQVGYVLSYEGNKELGSGEQELIGLQQNKKVDIIIRFLKPFKSISKAPYDLEAAGNNGTIVTWTMFGKMNYPLNLVLLFMDMDSFLGKDVQKSLDKLKANLEK